jgi:hypothetical protein
MSLNIPSRILDLKAVRTLLDGFQFDLRSGAPTVPLLAEGQGQFSIVTETLSRKTAAPFLETVSALVGDTRRVYRDILQRHGMKPPYGLRATNDQWELFQYEEREVLYAASPEGLFLGRIIFENQENRFVEIDLTDPESCTLESGWAGDHASASQFACVSRRNHFIAGGYHFEFNGVGLLGLGSSVGYLSELALEVALLIYRSGQYEPAEMVRPDVLVNGQLYPIRFDGERFIWPEEVPANAAKFEIGFSSAFTEEFETESVPQPTVTIGGELIDGTETESLRIVLRRPSTRDFPQNMPLETLLREKLWDEAKKIVDAELSSD